MQTNWYIVLATALIPLVVGFVYYHPKVLGTAWMDAAGVHPDSGKNMNMVKVFGLSFLYAMLLAVLLPSLTIHQGGLFQTLMNDGVADPNTEAGQLATQFMLNYGDRFRSFKHGALHGFLAGIFLVLPVRGTSALYEGHSFKHVMISVGYWAISMALMGGVICAYA